jgi:hypothetical protein
MIRREHDMRLCQWYLQLIKPVIIESQAPHFFSCGAAYRQSPSLCFREAFFIVGGITFVKCAIYLATDYIDVPHLIDL